jgi:hypothetical protein
MLVSQKITLSRIPVLKLKAEIIHMFIALFTIAESWRGEGYPLIDKWMNKMWYIHNDILLNSKRGVIWV